MKEEKIDFLFRMNAAYINIIYIRFAYLRTTLGTTSRAYRLSALVATVRRLS